MTLDTYSHVSLDLQKQAAARMNEELGERYMVFDVVLIFMCGLDSRSHT